MEEIYKTQTDEENVKDKDSQGLDSGTTADNRMLLTTAGASDIVALFKLNDSALTEVLKALEQTRLRLDKARQQL